MSERCFYIFTAIQLVVETFRDQHRLETSKQPEKIEVLHTLKDTGLIKGKTKVPNLYHLYMYV